MRRRRGGGLGSRGTAGHYLKYPAISGTRRGALATSFAIGNKQSCALAAAAPYTRTGRKNVPSGTPVAPALPQQPRQMLLIFLSIASSVSADAFSADDLSPSRVVS